MIQNENISIKLFEKHIADMYQDGDRIYLKFLDEMGYKVSQLMLSSNQKQTNTTHLVYLERVFKMS